MSLVVVGLNHKRTPLHIREKVSFSELNIDNSYELLKNYTTLDESMILSTCNRVELYGVGEDTLETVSSLKNFLYRIHEIAPGSLDAYLYTLTNCPAIHHLCRVAAGLNSMIIGENQILGQVRRAYQAADEAATIGGRLHQVLQDALRLGKKIRNETNIAKGVTSISGSAVELIKREYNLINKTTVVIGAGKIGSLTVRKLADLPMRKLVLLNRNASKAEHIKKGLNLHVGSYLGFLNEIAAADIIVTASAADNHLITKEMIENIMQETPKKRLLIDLGVPRNIEETIKNIEEIRLYNVDDLGSIIDETIKNRIYEAKNAEKIIQDQICAKSLSVYDQVN